MSGIGVIHNPNAKKNRGKNHIVPSLRKIVGKSGIVEETKHPDEIPRATEKFRNMDIDILAINGGDGTNHLTLTHFLKVYAGQPIPPFIHLRGGTMNTVANSLGISREPTEQILKKIADKYTRREKMDVIKRNIMKIGDKYGFIFGSGLVANFLEAYYEGRTTGPGKAIRVIAKSIISAISRTEYIKKLFMPVNARVSADSREIPLRYFTLLLGATIKDVGLGFKPTYLGDKAGTFHLLASDISPIRVILSLPKVLKGIPLGLKNVHDLLDSTSLPE